MPEITAIGWFHTVVGIIAILSGTYSLWMHREITLESKTGQVYLVTTLVTAATALAIYQFGSFGVAHGLAVLTLVALLAGYMASITTLFGGWSCYLRAVSWTSTLFFHSLPAVTDALMRLPVGSPVVTSIDDPLLLNSYRVLIVLLFIGLIIQLRWIRGQQLKSA